MAKFLATLFLAACVVAQDAANLTEFLTSQEDLSILAQAITFVPQLVSALPSGNITILAPVNSAFDGIDVGQLAANPSLIVDILSYHVLNGTYLSSDFLETPQFLKTLLQGDVTGGQNLGVIRSGDVYQILSGNAAVANVTEADLTAGNITVHKIGSVLEIPQAPSLIASRAGLTAAAAALNATNLTQTVDTVSDLTLFAPINAAFESIASIVSSLNETQLADVLLYHAVTGSVLFSTDAGNVTVPSAAGPNITISVIDGTVFVNSAKVIIPNIISSNGVIHVIDAVLNSEEEVNRDELDPEATPSPAFPDASSGSVPVATPTGSATTPITIPPVYTTAPPVPTGTSSEEPPEPTGGDENSASSLGKGIYATLGLSVVIAYLML